MNKKEQEESSTHNKESHAEHSHKESSEHADAHAHKESSAPKDKKKSKEYLLQVQVLELTNTVKRTQADFENYKKRTETNQQDFVAYAGVNTIKKFIPILEHLELALQHANKEDNFAQGVQMIFNDMLKTLEELGVTTIETENKPFNPAEHEAVGTEEHKEKNIIVKEIQKGYKIKDKVLRPAKVIVSK